MLTIKDLLYKIFPTQDVTTCVEVYHDGIAYSIPIYYDTDLYGGLGSGYSPSFAFTGKDFFIPEVI